MSNLTLSSRLAELRHQRRITQTDLAKALGVTDKTISKRKAPKLLNAQKGGDA
ncbi:MAG: helix-turn-helix domain-containing protein [Firmicutes bacterium]|nr:helix-turn-helix domain-containing protein [Bacillota bacterium]